MGIIKNYECNEKPVVLIYFYTDEMRFGKC